RGPSTRPTMISATPIPVATIRNSRVGRYWASTCGSLLPLPGSGLGWATGPHARHSPRLSCRGLAAVLANAPRGTGRPGRAVVHSSGIVASAKTRVNALPPLSTLPQLSAETKKPAEAGLLRPAYTPGRVLVPKRGLEPLRLSSLPPQGSASTNSATWAETLAPAAARGALYALLGRSSSLLRIFLLRRRRDLACGRRGGRHLGGGRRRRQFAGRHGRSRRDFQLAHHAQILVHHRARAVGGVPGHEQADAEEHHGQPLGALGQEVGRAARAEHRAGGARAEAGAGGRASAALQQDQHDHGDRHQHVHHVEDQHQHCQGLAYRAAAAARAMARKSAATREAPPISPPSTSGCAHSAPALSGFTLPPYRMGSESAILASCAAIWRRMKACISWAC